MCGGSQEVAERLTACSAQGLDRIYGFPFVRGPLNSFFHDQWFSMMN